MNTEVCYERLRPAHIRERREACPVVYVPLGTLEWHGFHNPVGLDGVKMHALCCRCAQEGGGLVFPTLFYGEPREEGLMDTNPLYRTGISGAMGLEPGNFEPGFMRRPLQEVVIAYQQLLLHVLNECQSLGFRVIVFGAGHYPLIDHARAAASVFHQQRWNGKRRDPQPIPWVFIGCELVQKEIPGAGGHAGFWETSLMLALEPGLVDMTQLPRSTEEIPLAVHSDRPVQEASAEFGEQAVQMIVKRVTHEVHARLENPSAYLGHGLRL